MDHCKQSSPLSRQLGIMTERDRDRDRGEERCEVRWYRVEPISNLYTFETGESVPIIEVY